MLASPVTPESASHDDLMVLIQACTKDGAGQLTRLPGLKLRQRPTGTRTTNGGMISQPATSAYDVVLRAKCLPHR
jgi:hypothetical protein